MTRFVNENEHVTIDLGEGDWVKVPAKISWKLLTTTAKQQGDDLAQISSRLLAKLVVEWNLKDANGNVVPISEDAIDRLDARTGVAIMNVINPLITSELDPKALAGSAKP